MGLNIATKYLEWHVIVIPVIELRHNSASEYDIWGT